MPKAAPSDVRRKLDRLRALQMSSPARQAEFATELIATERNAEVLLAAGEVLVTHPDGRAHEPLAAAYSYFAADGKKRDPGGMVRAGMMRALRLVAVPGDVALFERAIETYEPSPMDPGAPAVLRAAGVAALQAIDPVLACYHAVRLLGKTGTTARMTGEPALTAVRVLYASGEDRAIYLYALTAPDPAPEVLAECLRSLEALPPPMLVEVCERFSAAGDDVVLIGLCDLFVAAGAPGPMAAFLKHLESVEVYGYLAAAVVASRKMELLQALIGTIPFEFDRRKLALLADALEYAPPDPATTAAIAAARTRAIIANQSRDKGEEEGRDR
ncbi:MAG: hypothetical protein HYX53_00130 [Chloroflexi bacterium]|nr:hypothetical protein [Chloroflexota bacterium]